MRGLIALFAVAAPLSLMFAFGELRSLKNTVHPQEAVVDPPIVDPPVVVTHPPVVVAHPPRELSTWRGPNPFGGVPSEDPVEEGIPAEPFVEDREDIDAEEPLVAYDRALPERSRVLRLEELIY